MQIDLKQLATPMRKTVSRAVQAADSLGLSLYLVGGPVRDLWLRRNCRDLDLAVEGDALALAKRLASQTKGSMIAHERFRTAKLTWPDGAQVDLASTRAEVYSVPGALPRVTPADIRTDLGRRDFSINALALALNGLQRGKCLDFFHGQQDLQDKKIRVLHAQSFRDDPTRLFRAVRFEQRLKFKLEAKTCTAFVQALAQGGLRELSAARLWQELRLVLQEGTYAAGLKRLAQLGVLAQVHPGLQAVPARLAHRLEQACAQSRAWGGQEVDDSLVKCLALVAPLTPAQLKSWLKVFPWPRTWTAGLQFQKKQVSRFQATPAGLKKLSPAEWVAELETWPRENLAFTLGFEPRAVLAGAIQKYLSTWAQIKPALTGEDLKLLGYAPGPGFGKMLAALRRVRLAGQVDTRTEEKAYLLAHFPKNYHAQKRDS